ncbi:MAG: hypothetical protein ACR2F2_07075 [Pyrinomonadaceae bacterium]
MIKENPIKILMFVFILSSVYTAFAQECKKNQLGEKIQVEAEQTFDVNDYKDWQKINLSKISFYLPSDFKENKERKPYHPRQAFLYENEDFTLGIDLSNSAYYPGDSDKELPSYCERYVWIDEAFGYIWHFKPNKNFAIYNSGVYFQFERSTNYAVGFNLLSKTKQTKDIAEKIFKSVKFNYRPPKDKSI